MWGFLGTVFGWLTGIVAAVALVAGPSSAAHIAGNALGTVGITAGAMIGSIGDLVNGFTVARDATSKSGTNDTGFLTPAPQHNGHQRHGNRNNG